MKSKSKIRLSGQWWHPIRHFELVYDDNIVETISLLQTLEDKKPLWRKTTFDLSCKALDGTQCFTLNKNIGRNMNVFVEGSLSEYNGHTKINGRVGFGNLVVFGIISVVQLVFLVGLAPQFLNGGSALPIHPVFFFLFFSICLGIALFHEYLRA